MKYVDYDERVWSVADLEYYKKIFEKDIASKQEELEGFVNRANERIKWIEECERNKNYIILGRTFKNGRNKEIMLIIRYPDGNQRDERYSFSKISELRDKMKELEEKYSGVDWSAFDYEI